MFIVHLKRRDCDLVNFYVLILRHRKLFVLIGSYGKSSECSSTCAICALRSGSHSLFSMWLYNRCWIYWRAAGFRFGFYCAELQKEHIGLSKFYNQLLQRGMGHRVVIILAGALI